MKVIRNLSVVGWWFGMGWLLENRCSFLFVAATLLLIAGPWLRYFGRRQAPVIPPIALPSGVARYSAVCTMSWLSVTKAAIGRGLVTPNRGGMAERSS
jgi:hypothetical protein